MNTKLITFVMLATFGASAQDVDIELPPKELVENFYEYCTSVQVTEEVDNEKLLICINDELKEGDYKTFNNIEEVEAYILDNKDDDA